MEWRALRDGVANPGTQTPCVSPLLGFLSCLVGRVLGCSSAVALPITNAACTALSWVNVGRGAVDVAGDVG